MIDLKAGFHNLPLEHETSYNSTFVTHKGKFWWIRMLMGLTQVAAHFQFMVEGMPKGKPDEEELPVLVYLDDIAVFGDSIEEGNVWSHEETSQSRFYDQPQEEPPSLNQGQDTRS